jgi:hypothetical protein
MLNKFLVRKRTEGFAVKKDDIDPNLAEFEDNFNEDFNKNFNFEYINLNEEDKQKYFIEYVISTLKRDGQRIRTKDAKVRKTFIELFSRDLKIQFKQELYKFNPQTEYDKYATELIEKHDN